MDYLFGPSRVTAKAAHGAWGKISKGDLNKYLTSKKKGKCKRVVECLATVAPLLEEAAHQIVVEEWWVRLWRQVRVALILTLLLLLIGGVSLVSAVVYSDSYAAAFKTILARLKRQPQLKSILNI